MDTNIIRWHTISSIIIVICILKLNQCQPQITRFPKLNQAQIPQLVYAQLRLYASKHSSRFECAALCSKESECVIHAEQAAAEHDCLIAVHHQQLDLVELEVSQLSNVSDVWVKQVWSEESAIWDDVYRSLIPSDCADVYKKGRTESGVYTIMLQNNFVDSYCDMRHGGGWTVFQKRYDGSVEFYLQWQEYKLGFGNLTTEFWWGNDKLASLTATKAYILRVDMENEAGAPFYAEYSTFSVAAEDDKYRLTVAGYTGTAGDPLSSQNGVRFSTPDNDNDRSGQNCAAHYHGAFWFEGCGYARPNGRYYRHWDGINWHEAINLGYNYPVISMKIRGADY